MSAPPGLDPAALHTHLDHTHPGLVTGDLEASLITGGRSNLTYRVTDATTTWVLRRPPLGHVLATAHDMAREVRVIRALRDTAVPVPAVIELCEDEAVLGAPFYVMEYVAGQPYRTAAELSALGEERTEAISRRCVETLAALHAVDPAAVGLADLGRPEGFLARQVRRWGQQRDASGERDLPALAALRARLEAAEPPTGPVGIVHGDYRIDNVLVDDRDRIAAVVDWEMATLGDVFTDLGLMLTYEQVSGLAPGLADSASAPGFLRGADTAAAYERASGRALPPLGFYTALAAYKLAVILEGIHYRFTLGKTAGGGFDRIGEAVEPAAELGLAALAEQA